MPGPSLPLNAMPWGRDVDKSLAATTKAIVDAQDATRISGRDLQDSIRRTALILESVKQVSDFLVTLRVVRAESRTNAIGV